jgi:hypothetical protein
LLPGFHGRYCRWPMEIIMQANVDRFEVVALQQIVVICINVWNIEPGRDLLRQGFVNVCYGHDLSSGDTLIVFEMLLASLSRADQPYTNRSVF